MILDFSLRQAVLAGYIEQTWEVFIFASKFIVLILAGWSVLFRNILPEGAEAESNGHTKV